jgi:GTPase involved in cell partitioning and DNA repair
MKPIDKIISFFREEGMMTANPPGGSGGFGGASPAKGPRAGFDPVMKKMIRRKKTVGLWASSLKKKKKK